MNLLLMLAAAAQGQVPASIAGRWHGESICVKGAWNANCDDAGCAARPASRGLHGVLALEWGNFRWTAPITVK